MLRALDHEDADTTWVGQPGGCEGLRQKGWTSIVVAILELNRMHTGIESTQVEQGDNVIIVAKISKLYPEMKDNEYISKFQSQILTDCNSYMKNIRRISGGLGMIIKLEETWCSTVLLNYGKRSYLREPTCQVF